MLLAAQQGMTSTPATHLKHPFVQANALHSPGAGERSDATALWSEDFETGLNGWTVETSEGAVDWTLTSTGNTNGYTPGPLESATGFPNGHWIVADSDAEGTADVSENTSITSPLITGFDTVSHMLLLFEQSFRQLNNDQTLVEVSGNGGLDWTVYEVNHALAGNESTPGAPAGQTIVLNITSALAQGSGGILLRFRWVSDQGFTYSWQVDDVALLPVRPNDLVLQAATSASWYPGPGGYENMPCTIYPLGETRELKFKGIIGNNGSLPQTNVHLRVDVTGPDGYSTILNSSSIDLLPGASDSLFILDYEPPSIIGDYAFHISVVQDAEDDEPTDNSIDQQIRVDANLFARDEGQLTSVRNNGTYDYILGNRFWIEGYGRTLEAVEVALGPGTEVGASISALVYDGYFHFEALSDPHTITQYEINDLGGGTFISLPLVAPLELDNDRLYLVCVFVEAVNGEVFTGLSGQSPPQTSMIYRMDTESWYYTTNTPMVRMRLGDLVGIPDAPAGIAGLMAYPSPFDGKTTISFSDERGAAVRWELCDATGRVVRTGALGERPPGERRILLDGEGLADGIYTMAIFSGGSRSTVKLVHQSMR